MRRERCAICHEKRTESLSFFSVPKIEAKRNRWNESCGMILKASQFVCQDHFAPCDFIHPPGDPKAKARLHPGALPAPRDGSTSADYSNSSCPKVDMLQQCVDQMEFLNRQSLSQALTLLKAENDNMDVNIQELPEIIIIDTQFTTRRYCEANLIDPNNILDITEELPVKAETAAETATTTPGTLTTAPTLLPMVQLPSSVEDNTIYDHTQQLTQLIPNTTVIRPHVDETQSNVAATTQANPVTSVNVGVTAKVAQVDVETSTDNPNPTRDREVQTGENEPFAKEIGIQCSLDVEEEEQPEVMQQAVMKNTFEEFMLYMKANAREYSNGKLECLVCGEVCQKVDKMETHMALHWGPEVMCELCGEQMEHECLLQNHHCTTKKLKKREKFEKQLLKTPYASSLYMNLLLRTRAKSKPKGKHQRISSLFWKNNRLYFKISPSSKLSIIPYCTVCLKRCSNSLKATRHQKRCLEDYLQRLKLKRKQLS